MGKQSGGDKKQQLFEAIVNQKLQAVRWGVANAGVAPATRDAEGHTTFMIACLNGKDRSLAEMVRWYERRLSQLRECLEQVDEDRGRTPLHQAAANPAGLKCCSELLDAWLTVDKDRRDAGLRRKDRAGKTPYDVATPKAKALFDDWLREPETESEDEAVGEDGLTSTQRSKEKKKALLAKERAGGAAAAAPPTAPSAEAEAAAVERGEFVAGTPTPTWPEVEKWAQSVKDLKPICELAVVREAGDELPALGAAGPDEPATVVDPALFWCDTVNRLSLKVGPRLDFLSPVGVARLAHLTHLILAGNGLTALPETLKDLPLKSLDASRNALAALPPAMPAALEALDLSYNAIPSLAPALDGCENLVCLQCDANELAALDLPFPSLKRLVTLTVGANKLAELPDGLGDLAKLEALTLNGNADLAAIPATLAKCKKLKDLKCDGCAIADNKVLGYVQKGEYKQLAKYLEKTAAKGGGGGGGKKKGGGKKR